MTRVYTREYVGVPARRQLSTARESDPSTAYRYERVTHRAPAKMLDAEQTRLHPVPTNPHSVAFGVTRTVPAKMPMVSYDGGMYSVLSELLGQRVWVPVHGQGAEVSGLAFRTFATDIS